MYSLINFGEHLLVIDLKFIIASIIYQLLFDFVIDGEMPRLERSFLTAVEAHRMVDGHIHLPEMQGRSATAVFVLDQITLAISRLLRSKI